MSALTIAARLLLAIVIAAVLFIALSLVTFHIAWYFFGLTGHPAAPAAPGSIYLTYLVAAPLLCLGTGVWLVFRRRPRNHPS
ncbi:MAG TPA: hypothetical protein VFG84_02950 [Gemmatimonadaceae bacterium]|nr:hypothetical protein [Gemmatimonadaceae bacterium]